MLRRSGLRLAAAAAAVPVKIAGQGRGDLSWVEGRAGPTAGGRSFGISDDDLDHKVLPAGTDVHRQRAFYYTMTVGMWASTAHAARCAAAFVLGTFLKAATFEALANVEVEIGHIKAGQTVVVDWRGKPIFVRHRTDEEIEETRAVDVKTLRDPATDEDRCQKAEWLVAVGICTHLGCVPLTNAGEFRAYFCPCHGSHYDHAARIRRGPAPLNLALPPHKHCAGDILYLGDLDKAPK